MGKYFGTDGIRGRANDTLTLDKAIKIGRYLGAYYGQSGHARHTDWQRYPLVQFNV